MPRRSCGRSSPRSSALFLRRRNRREEALDDFSVRLIIEIPLDDLARACNGQLDRLATQLGDCILLLALDLAARALEHLLLLLVRLFYHLRAQVFADLTSLDDDLLRLRSCCFDLSLLLGESASCFLSITLRTFDCFLERFFACFDRCSDFRKDESAQNDQ